MVCELVGRIRYIQNQTGNCCVANMAVSLLGGVLVGILHPAVLPPGVRVRVKSLFELGPSSI